MDWLPLHSVRETFLINVPFFYQIGFFQAIQGSLLSAKAVSITRDPLDI